MAIGTMTGLLKSQLLQDFFTTASRVRARGTYSINVPIGDVETRYSENEIDVSFTYNSDADNATDIAATLVNPFPGDDPLFVLVNIGDEFEIEALEFIDEANNVYLEWEFDANEIVFTGNGEINIENIEIKMS